MITFQCHQCALTLTAVDRKSGRTVICPACRYSLTIPAQTPVELQDHALTLLPGAATPVTTSIDWEGFLYADLTPELGRRMMKRLVEGLLGQRRQLMQTQDTGTEQLTMLEARMAQLQQRHRERIQEFTLRLAAREAEIMRLRREKSALLRELEGRVVSGEVTQPVELRDVRLLLRA